MAAQSLNMRVSEFSQFRRVVRRKPCAAFCDFDAQGTYFEVMM
jgi:hypothetical protein